MASSADIFLTVSMNTRDDHKIHRPPTVIDGIAERFFRAFLRLSPISATYLGYPDDADGLDDLSPDGLTARATLAAQTMRELSGAEPSDEVDVITAATLRERLGLELAKHETGLDLLNINVAISPLQEFRTVLDLMPTADAVDRAAVGARLNAVPQALDRWADGIALAFERGVRTSERQLRACAVQARSFAAPGGYFRTLASQHPTLATACSTAARGYQDIADRLEKELLPLANSFDACGRERYQLLSADFLGDTVDVDEAYEWALDELRAITQRAGRLARASFGVSAAEAMAALESDENYIVEGSDALRQWMQDSSEAALAFLDGSHFDIPAELRVVECRIAGTRTGMIYYTPPSSDFSRPGRVWWSVPEGQSRFSTWRELTTVYHEGAPGHHLQSGTALLRSGELNSWRRMLCWTAGHEEGWALYAERLMDELGFLEDPGYQLGMLNAQALRTARVLIDIGVHCQKRPPAGFGATEWSYQTAEDFLARYVVMTPQTRRFELDRYFGWPGQAASYKLGERVWLEVRDTVRRRAPEAFDLKSFHREALDLGGLGLAVLRQAFARP